MVEPDMLGCRRLIALGAQMFLGTEDKVYIIDKTEANPQKVNGHPAWASGELIRVHSIVSC